MNEGRKKSPIQVHDRHRANGSLSCVGEHGAGAAGIRTGTASQTRTFGALACPVPADGQTSDNSNDAQAVHRLGALAYAAKRYDEAASLLSKVCQLRPRFAEAHNDLGAALEAIGDSGQAIEHYRRAVQLKPAFYQARVNLANALLKSADVGAAARECSGALRIESRYSEAHNVMGAVLLELGERQQAAACFREAIRLQPTHAEAHTNLGLMLLMMGDFENGWREHEWRRRRWRPRPGKAWDGSDPFGKTLLLHTEGGLGNAIQFVRYVRVLADMGAQVVLECQPELTRVLQAVQGVWKLVGRGEPVPRHDVYCPLMSLPATLGTKLETIPSRAPYLEADPARVKHWRNVLGGVEGLRVGICWQGEQKLVHRRNRSIPLSEFAPLSRIPGIRLVSLQRGCPLGAAFPLMELPGLDETGGAFMDTAAVMKHLDLIITCDTSIAHLAGALGVPVWVALPFAADFRWMIDREDSPWYPTMRLFRQSRPGDWPTVFARIRHELGPRLP